MSDTSLNYQLIYEEIITQQAKDTMELPMIYSDLNQNLRRFLEEFADASAQQATDLVLDPEIMAETASLAAEMSTQLHQFASMLTAHTDDPASILD